MNLPVSPAAVTGNDWTTLAVTPSVEFTPTLPVTVVVTYYEAPEALELTLAALARQSYPRELFEVVIVDDGSRQPLAQPTDGPLNPRVVHQEDRGFGLARARNTGARAASHDIFVFLDCDMMPEADWLHEHARWHHAASDVLTLGFRAHVDVADIDSDTIANRPGSLDELFADRASQRPEWIEFHMSRTNNLTSDADDIFRIVTGGNLGISRNFFEIVGGYDESFTQWGAEDTEFGYRAYTRGGLLVPVREAMCWHQGEGAAPSADESASLELQRAKISQLIAHHGFRRAGSGRSFAVPQYVVTIRSQVTSVPTAPETVEQVLANSVHDLVVWVEEPRSGASDHAVEREMLRRLFTGDPRVRFGSPGGALEAFPAASFHITIPADATVAANAVQSLRRQLGSAPAAATNPLDHANGVSIVRAWALHRAARRGLTLVECEAVLPLGLNDVEVYGSWREHGHVPPSALARRNAAALWFLRRMRRRFRHLLSARAWMWFFRRMRRRFRHLLSARAWMWFFRRMRRRFRHLLSARAWMWFFRRMRRRFRHLLSARAWMWFFRRMRRRFRHLLSARAWMWFFRRMRRRFRHLGYFISRNTRRAWNILGSIRREASRVRNPGDFRAFVGWATRSVRVIADKRLARVRDLGSWVAGTTTSVFSRIPLPSWRPWPRKTDKSSQPDKSGISLRHPRPVRYRLGPPMAPAGSTASAVFAASADASGPISPHTQVVIADTADDLEELQVPTAVVLADLEPSASVPAFDAEQFNPTGWNARHRSAHTNLSAALGRRLDAGRLKRLRRYHHVKDTAANHRSTSSRAGILTAAAASGVLVQISDADPDADAATHPDAPSDLELLLGSELYSLMTDSRISNADMHQREALSIAMRRCALRDHSLRARARHVLATTGLQVPGLPSVTVLLATRRPHRLAAAVAAVKAQTYPHVELVLAPHGEGFDSRVINTLIDSADLPAQVVPVPGHAPLGAVLNAAVEASTGTLLTKFDDDDFYGPEHLWDLVLAREYSQACLVGKAAEYIYLTNSNRTIQRFRNQSERLSATLAGGALMISRHDLDGLLGWREVPAGVDRALIDDVARSKQRSYRTHGMGYMLVRHNEGHTWSARDAYFLKEADEIREGCDLSFAGIT